MQTSEQINELATALAKAQGEITGALKDSANPFFKSKYADLASCWDACRAALSKNGLAVVQAPETNAVGYISNGSENQYEKELALTTTLIHTSGQWMRAQLAVNPKDDSPQSMGSAITYARRYALCAFVGIAQVDDDGNAASGKVSVGNGSPAEVAQVHPDLVFKASVQMRELLEMDVEEHIKALKVLDYHDLLNKDQRLYNEAARALASNERSSWKVYVAQAKAAEREDQRVDKAGKRF
jgi:hypothetical protein